MEMVCSGEVPFPLPDLRWGSPGGKKRIPFSGVADIIPSWPWGLFGGQTKTRDYPGACRFRLRALALFLGAFLQVVIVGIVENYRLAGGANIHNIGFAAYYLNHFFHGCFRELFTAAAAFFHRLFLLRMMGLTLGLMVIVALSPISG